MNVDEQNTIFHVSYSYLNADRQTYCYIKRTTCQATVGLALLGTDSEHFIVYPQQPISALMVR